MDDLDRELIALLRENARLPITSLSESLGVARATVRARIDKLVETGLIRGFTVALNDEVRGRSIRALTLIEVEGSLAEQVIKNLMGFPDVRAVHTTNGKWDVIAELEINSLLDFDEILRRIRLVRGIKLTETNILLTSKCLNVSVDGKRS